MTLQPYTQITPETDTALMALINYLRAEEGDSVNLLCDNPEGPPNNAVVCCGDWTNWQDRRFDGDSLFQSLNRAALSKASATDLRAAKAPGHTDLMVSPEAIDEFLSTGDHSEIEPDSPAASSPSAVGVPDPVYADGGVSMPDDLCIMTATPTPVPSAVEGLFSAADALVDDLMSMSDEELIKEAKEDGVDVGALVQSVRQSIACNNPFAPTPAPSAGDATEKVDWQVVGPKLVEAGAELAEAADEYENDGERRRNNRLLLAIEAFRAAMALAQPQSNGGDQ